MIGIELKTITTTTDVKIHHSVSEDGVDIVFDTQSGSVIELHINGEELEEMVKNYRMQKLSHETVKGG